MRENIPAPAGERVAEGRAAPSVHNIGGHHAEVQTSWHLQEHLELIDHGTVLRCGDVKFDKPSDSLLTSCLADAQVCRLAAEWANSAGLDAELVEPALFRTGFPEPPR